MNNSLGWSELARRHQKRTFGGSALRDMARRWGDPIRQVLESPLAGNRRHKPFDPSPIRQLFSLEQPQHCFGATSHDWARFHEPQITGGLVHFMNAGGRDMQLSRALAFYRAACRCSPGQFAELTADQVADFEVVAEEPTANTKARGRKRVERGKLDILVNFEGTDGTLFGSALEAKFDFSLSPRQLEKYTEHLDGERKWSVDRSPLLLVGRRAVLLADDHRWCSTNWWRFLLRFERELSEANDNDSFRSFRRTIWDTAYA